MDLSHHPVRTHWSHVARLVTKRIPDVNKNIGSKNTAHLDWQQNKTKSFIIYQVYLSRWKNLPRPVTKRGEHQDYLQHAIACVYKTTISLSVCLAAFDICVCLTKETFLFFVHYLEYSPDILWKGFFRLCNTVMHYNEHFVSRGSAGTFIRWFFPPELFLVVIILYVF